GPLPGVWLGKARCAPGGPRIPATTAWASPVTATGPAFVSTVVPDDLLPNQESHRALGHLYGGGPPGEDPQPPPGVVPGQVHQDVAVIREDQVGQPGVAQRGDVADDRRRLGGRRGRPAERTGRGRGARGPPGRPQGRLGGPAR